MSKNAQYQITIMTMYFYTYTTDYLAQNSPFLRCLPKKGVESKHV